MTNLVPMASYLFDIPLGDNYFVLSPFSEKFGTFAVLKKIM